MQFKITAPENTINTTIHLPSSKSISNRALIINALSKGTLYPENLSDCDDTRVMVHALTTNENTIDIMAAGTAMRFLTAYLSVTEGCKVITGTERMQQRPIYILVDALRELGADISYVKAEGYPPLRICGKELTKDRIALPGNMSSQYISALLMIAPTLKNGLTIQLTGEIISKPYILLTLQIMKDFGIEANQVSENIIEVPSQSYKSVPFIVESDWSAASYWYQIIALSEDEKASVKLPGLFKTSYQGDSKVSTIFNQLGVETVFINDHEVILTKSNIKVDKLEYDFINEPDLAQTFAVTCCMLNLPFRFTGLQSLKIKETDRMTALIAELGKLGYVLKEEKDSVLIWNGERKGVCEKPTIDTYEDHRMAMAFAPACLKITDLWINEPKVVSKSYPYYWEDLKKAGFTITEQ